MASMFSRATSFNADVTGWDESALATANNMFYDATAWTTAFTNCGYTAGSPDASICTGSSYASSSAATNGPPSAWQENPSPPPPP
eukprot:3877-Pelagococcus_subviridis.AAC.1